MKVFLDSSVIIAACVHQHPHHGRAAPILRSIIAKRWQGGIAAHSLAEVFAVLTTLPVRPGIAPREAAQLLEENVERSCAIIALRPKDYQAVVADLSQQGMAGGIVYDALILMAAQRFGSERIYTFNLDHSRRIAPQLGDKLTAP